MNNFIAHSKNRLGIEHNLRDHLLGVADIMATFTDKMIYNQIFRITGLLHDFGKYQLEFQKYLVRGGMRGSVPHASWGAAYCRILKQQEAAFAIDGHHKGLPDRAELQTDINGFKNKEKEIELKKILSQYLSDNGITENDLVYNQTLGLIDSERELFIRYLFSALTDADWLDTEKHFKREKFESRPNKEFNSEILLEKLEKEIKSKNKEGWINQLRNNVREYVIIKAKEETGFFSMTLPTGMGKTLASVSWALHHSAKNNLKRIIIVLPYISIIDQTASELKRIFGEEYILEHHSSFAEDDKTMEEIRNEAIQDEGQAKRLATENWDFPIVITTTVQFFESLFSNKPSRTRKVHNIAQSVVIFDEVQSLPKEILLPTLEMLKNVQKVMNTSFLFCTATLPAFEKREKFDGIENIKPLVENPVEIYSKTRRVSYLPVNDYQPVEMNYLYENVLKQAKSVICIFNTKKKAREFSSFLEDTQGYWWFHLSTYLCPWHRKKIIRAIQNSLTNKKKIIVSSTQLIEAGVDFDFPCVFREIAPLEGIIQSAGRCNREGKMEQGNVFIFRLTDDKAPDKQYKSLANFALNQFRGSEEKLFTHDFFSYYYQHAVDLFCNPDKRKINDLRKEFKFESVTGAYKLIETKTTSLFVYNYNRQSREIYNRIKNKPFLSRDDYRSIQLFIVQVYDNLLKEFNHLIGREKDNLLIWHGRYDSHYGVCPDINKELDTLIF